MFSISNDEANRGNVYTDYDRTVYFIIENNEIYITNYELQNCTGFGTANEEEIKEAKQIEDDLTDLLEWDRYHYYDLGCYLKDYVHTGVYCNCDIDEMLKMYEEAATEFNDEKNIEIYKNFKIIYDRLKKASQSFQDFAQFVAAYYEQKSNEFYYYPNDDLDGESILLHDFFVNSYDGPTKVEELEDYDFWLEILSNIDGYRWINMFENPYLD